MAKDKKNTEKLEFERTYTVPLRREWLKAPKSHRGKKAVRALKEFMVRHMKVYDRDLRKVKVDITLNNEIRFRGMRKPPAKILVKAQKFSNGIVKVELVNVPEHIKFLRLKQEKNDKKIKKEIEKKKEEKTEEKPDTNKPEDKTETDAKEEASKEEELKRAKDDAKEQKHVSKDKKVIMHRRALSR